MTIPLCHQFDICRTISYYRIVTGVFSDHLNRSWMAPTDQFSITEFWQMLLVTIQLGINVTYPPVLHDRVVTCV